MADSSLKTLGATNLAIDKSRSPLEYYGTDPKSTRSLLDVEEFDKEIWEPCAGHHLISNELEARGYKVRVSDISEYEGYEHEILNFLESEEEWDGDIIFNPPFNLLDDFILKGIKLLQPGHKLAVFCRTLSLEGLNRYKNIYSITPPARVYIFANRQVCSKNDDFTCGSAVSYCFMIWEKSFNGDTVIKWIKNN